MKTETQIAKENIERKINFQKMSPMNTAIQGVCKEHKATCQRWLEFLEDGFIEELYGIGVYKSMKEKITDLKQAIKLYDEAGI